MDEQISSKNKVNGITFFILELYTLLFLVGTHIFNPFMRVLFVVLFAATMFRIIKQNLVIDGYVKYMGYFVFLAFLSIIWAQYKDAALTGCLTIGKCALLGFSVYVLCDSKEKITRLLILFMVGVLLLDIYCSITLGVRGLLSLSQNDMRLGIESGTELNANLIGTTNVIGIIISLFFVNMYRKRSILFLTLIFFLFIILSASRAAFIEVSFGFMLFLLLLGGKNKIFRIPLYIFIATVVLIIAIRLGFLDVLLDRFTAASKSISYFLAGNYNSSDSNIRMRLIYEGLKLFIQKPIIGYGTSQFSILIDEVIGFAYSPHNAYTQSLVSYGILGFVFWQGMYVRILKGTLRQKNDKLAMIIVVLIFTWLLCDMFGHSITDKVSYFLIAIGFSYIKVSKKVQVEYE